MPAPSDVPNSLKRDEPRLGEFNPAAKLPRVETDDEGRPVRLVSLDAYRGFVMLLMVSSGFAFAHVAKTYPVELGLQSESGTPQSGFWPSLWNTLAYQFDHVQWVGCSLWDLIQPSFIFIVGAAMPLSEARRDALGQSRAKRLTHAAFRSLLLVLLGVFLMSNGRQFTMTHWSFVNVLTQIGLGYFFVYLLVRLHAAVQFVAAAAILVGYWYFFQSYQPTADEKQSVVTYMQEVELPKRPEQEQKPDWNQFPPTAPFASHYNKHLNAAAAFDRWFLNLAFPWQDRTPTAEADRQLGEVNGSLAALQGKLRAEQARQEAIARREDGQKNGRQKNQSEEMPGKPKSDAAAKEPRLTKIKAEGEPSDARQVDGAVAAEGPGTKVPDYELPAGAFVIKVPELQKTAEQAKGRFQETRDKLVMPLDEQARQTRFIVNEGGYQTLNFVPSAATMIFGLMAGGLLMNRRRSPGDKVRLLFLYGFACFALAMALDTTIWPVQIEGLSWTLCPTVKRIWTPSWTIFSTGWTLWLLAAFYWIIDVKRLRVWAFPFVVVGMNSIAVYLLAQLIKPWISRTLETHLSTIYLYSPDGLWHDLIKNNIYGPIYEALLQLLVIWLIALWMYKKKIFVRI